MRKVVPDRTLVAVRQPSDQPKTDVLAQSENQRSSEQNTLPEILSPVKALGGCGGQSLIAILIDAANLMWAARRLGGVPDYRAILPELSGGKRFVGTACVNVRHDTHEIAGFINMLRSLSLRVATWKPATVAGTVKSGDDVLLAVEAMRLACRPDVSELVLATGDSDLRPVVSHVRELGKRVTVAAFGQSISAALRRKANAFIELNAAHVIRSAATR